MIRNILFLFMLSLSVLFCGCSKTGEEYFNIGIKQYHDAKYKDAISTLKKAVKIEPDNIKAKFYLGMSYKNIGDFDKAIDYINQAKEITPEDFFILHNMADCYFNIAKYDEALKWCRKSLGVKPDFMEGHMLLGTILLKADKLKESMDEFEFISKVTAKDDPELSAQAKLAIGDLYRAQGDFTASEKVLLDLIKQNNKSPEYFYSLGLTYISMNKTDKLNETISSLDALKSPYANTLRDKIKNTAK